MSTESEREGEVPTSERAAPIGDAPTADVAPAPDAPAPDVPAPAAPAPAEPAPAPDAPAPAPPGEVHIEEKPRFIRTLRSWLHDYFLGDDPSFWLAIVPFCFLSMLLFTRHPTKTNFIFDEQEALLANPYVRSVADVHPKFHWWDAFYRDFWGLGPERSIGSYRPIPDLVWRALWVVARDSPFLHHWVNVLFHGMNGALVCILAFKLTRRRGTAWLAGVAFTASAVLTEAVSGVVGIADVLGATGALLALLALTRRLPWMAVSVFLACLFGLYSKETALVCVPLVPLTMLLCAQIFHPGKPQRWVRAFVAFAAAGTAFVLYVELRRRMFPAPLPPELSADAVAAKKPHDVNLLSVGWWISGARWVFASLLRWYAQPTLPKDPLNNPLVHADGPHRVAGALRVYFRGLVQVVFPHTLSGDYSAPQEPIPRSLWEPENLLGGILMALPIPLATFLGARSYARWRREHPMDVPRRRDRLVGAGACVAGAGALVATLGIDFRWTLWIGVPLVVAGAALVGFGLGVREPVVDAPPEPPADAEGSPYRGPAPPEEKPAPRGVDVLPVIAAGVLWVMLSYFPVSNIPVLLPTVRAERFWYFPVIGSCLILGIAFAALLRFAAARGKRPWAIAFVVAFFAFQSYAARNHANDYTDDLAFWDATRKAVPRSAKAHLNYSVMKGARGDLNARLAANRTALELAPDWPMASIYLGDTLCRLHRPTEAWPYYVRGFDLAPNDVNLIALALQCLWDEKALVPGSTIRSELETVKDRHPGSWIEYLGRDVLEHGEEHNGVDPKYRPRGYNEGPKD